MYRAKALACLHVCSEGIKTRRKKICDLTIRGGFLKLFIETNIFPLLVKIILKCCIIIDFLIYWEHVYHRGVKKKYIEITYIK